MRRPTARRTFLASLGAAPLLPAALAQVAPNPLQPASPTPAPSPGADVPGPVALALAEAARQRFAAHLAPGDVDLIAKSIQGNLQAAERLQRVELTNADEPVTAFAAVPPERRPAGRGGRR